MKLCARCNRVHSLELFSKNKTKPDGLQNVCKYCAKLYRLEYYRQKPQRLRIQSLKWRLKNRDKDKSGRRAAITKYRQNNRKKFLAQKSLAQRIRLGTLQREPCAVCKKLHDRENVRTQAHHCDYNDRENVMWLCEPHHKAWHRIFIAEA